MRIGLINGEREMRKQGERKGKKAFRFLPDVKALQDEPCQGASVVLRTP